MAAIVAAVVGGGLGLISGLVGAKASKDAAQTQADATRDAAQQQTDMYNQNREDLAPWRAAGEGALGQLSALTGANGEFSKNFGMSDFQADPGYQFAMDEGRKAIEHSASAHGTLLSGGTLKALQSYSQGLANQTYGQAYDRFMNNRTSRFNQLSSLAGLGQTATGQTAQLGANTAGNVGDYLTQGANASAAGTVGAANALTSGLSNGFNSWMQYNMLNQMAGPRTETWEF